MQSPADRLRAAIEAWRADEARERIARWRGAPDAASASDVAFRHRRLLSDEALEVLEQADGLGMFGAEERAALAAHLARAAAEHELAETRDRLRGLRHAPIAVGGHRVAPRDVVAQIFDANDERRVESLARALDERAERELPALIDARDAADLAASQRLAGAAPHPDAGPKADELVARANAFLDATDDLASEAVRWVLGGADGAPWHALARGLRARDLDGLVPRASRWRRLAGDVAALELARPLAERVRVEPSHGGLDPRARVVAIAPPTDVRIAQSPLELGVAGEVLAADAVGRALALALVSPALPPTLRRPLAATVARAFGTLLAQLHADAAHLAKARGIARREAERVARITTTVLALDARVQAAGVIVRRGETTGHARLELAADLVRRALRSDVPRSIAAVLAVTPSGSGARFRGRTSGLALWCALREHFDEDWYRNPRAEGPLRAAAERGGALSAEAVAGELGVTPEIAASRLVELFDRA